MSWVLQFNRVLKLCSIDLLLLLMGFTSHQLISSSSIDMQDEAQIVNGLLEQVENNVIAQAYLRRANMLS